MMLTNGSHGSNGSSSHNARPRPKVCLETSVFAALFGQQEGKWKMARAILQDERENRVQVMVSALVLVECEIAQGTGVAATNGVATDGAMPDTLPHNILTGDVVADFFESEFLTRCNVDPFTGELARRLRGDLNGVVQLTPNAWLWLATALLTDCDYLMTFEPSLHKLAGQSALGRLQVVPPARPWDAGQLLLTDVDGVMDLPPIAGTVQRRSIEI